VFSKVQKVIAAAGSKELFN